MKKILLAITAVFASAGLSAQTYCTPSYGTGCTFGDYIDDFTMGSFSDLSTGCSSSAYDNSTSDTVEVSVGTPTNFSLTAGYSGQYYGIFADFNSDGDFTDAGEFLWSNTAASGAAFTVTTGTLVVPSTYSTGSYRMRVVMIWNNGGAISATQSCPTSTYGETHDYTLKLTPPPACPAPAYLTLQAISDTSATISWSSSDTVFNVDYGVGGFSLATGAYTTVTAYDTVITITGLSPATYYDFYVTTNCTASSNGLSSISGPITVLTNCVPFTSPLFENFENDSTGTAGSPNAPVCWYYTEQQGAGGYGFVSDLSGGSYAGSNFYQLVNNSGGDREYLVTPEISDLDSADLQVEFWAKNPSTWNPNVEFIVGTMTVPTNPATFHAVDTIQITTANTWEKHTIYLDTNYGYNGTDLHIAFGTSSNSAYTTVYFDNIDISDAPSCLPAANFMALATNQDSALVSFQASASTVYIEYGPVGFLQGTGPIDTVTTGSPHWITGLNAGSTYEAYLWQDCNTNGTSPKIGPITFSTTACSSADQCEYTIVLTDSWGDGWNGGEVELYSNALGVLGTYGSTFTTGDYDTISVMLCTGYPLSLKVTDAGSYPSEMGIEVYKNGSLLDSYSASTSTSVGTTMANFTTNCGAFCAGPTSLTIGTVSQDSAQVFFTTSGVQTYIEYGPAGFTQGTGIVDSVAGTVNTYWIENLTSGTGYDVYIWQVCSNGGVSSVYGPLNFTTPACGAADLCSYDFELTDSYGDGWNGALVALKDGNGNTITTMGTGFTSGSSFTVTLDLCDAINFSVEVINQGSWPSEIGINVNKQGSTVATYAATPTTQTGTTMVNFTTNCTFNCGSPSNIAVVPSKYSADVTFQVGTGSTGLYYYEYGPQGFTQGTGLGTVDTTSSTSFTISGLNSLDCYDVYIYSDCGASGISDTVGPTTFCTEACYDSMQCDYTIYMYDSWGDGWNGAYLNVYAGGAFLTTLGQSFTTGTYAEATFSVCAGQDIDIIVGSQGNYVSEVSFDLYADYDSTQYVGVTLGNLPSVLDTVGSLFANCVTLSCATPDNIGVVTTATTATLSWTGGTGTFEYGYRPAANTTMTMGTSAVASTILTGLTPATNYYFEVHEICAPGDTSYNKSFYFTTDSCDFVATGAFNATLDTTWSNGQTFTFDWTGSYTGYSIDFGDGNTANGTTGNTVQHTYTAAGSYTATLTLTTDCDSKDVILFVNVGIGQVELPGVDQVLLYPNPTNGQFEVEISGLSEKAEVHLYNALGQELVNRTIDGTAGEQKATFDLSNYAAGAYRVKIVTPTGSVQQSVVKH